MQQCFEMSPVCCKDIRKEESNFNRMLKWYRTRWIMQSNEVKESWFNGALFWFHSSKLASRLFLEASQLLTDYTAARQCSDSLHTASICIDCGAPHIEKRVWWICKQMSVDKGPHPAPHSHDNVHQERQVFQQQIRPHKAGNTRASFPDNDWC